MSTPEHRELAELMLAKARADLSAARVLADLADQSDSVVGFHAQQACEKALKAVIADRELDVARVHDLEALVEMLAADGLVLPDALKEIDVLTPWAVTFRYDEPGSALDRAAAIGLASATVEWAAAEIDAER